MCIAAGSAIAAPYCHHQTVMTQPLQTTVDKECYTRMQIVQGAVNSPGMPVRGTNV